MYKLFFAVLLMNILWACPVLAKNEPVQSTQGIELEQDIAKSKPDTVQKNEQKQQANRSKKYLKVQKQTAKETLKKKQKQRKLEYLQNRLEVKKQKLEQLDSTTLKGEKE